MNIKKIEIEDDFPLCIQLLAKSVWRQNEKDEIVVERLLDRRENNCTLVTFSYTELKPSSDQKKLIDVLQYFFSVCNEHISPQCMWMTDDCSYNSLFINYDMDEKKQFDTVLNEITKLFPELKQTENFSVKIPKGKKLEDVISQIEVAYPETWTVEYAIEK